MAVRLFPTYTPPWTVVRRRGVVWTLATGNAYWRSVAAMVLFGGLGKRVLKKQPEYLFTDRVLIGQAISVAALQSMSRRQRRRQRKAQAGADPVS